MFWKRSQSLDGDEGIRPTLVCGLTSRAASQSNDWLGALSRRIKNQVARGVSRMIQPTPVPSNHGYEGEGGAFQSNDWRGSTFHAGFL